jgi:hypothetical protein
MASPEELARRNIDALLKQCGWIIRKRSDISRVLFLVERLGSARAFACSVRRLAECICYKFQQFVTPDDGRKFTELAA